MQYPVKPLTLAIFSLFASAVVTTQAQTQISTNNTNINDTADTKLVDEVVISGSRTATKLSETPQAIGVVKEDILKRDKPKTMGEVINRIAGVYWNDLGNEQHSHGHTSAD